jgi:hypothetical protein
MKFRRVFGRSIAPSLGLYRILGHQPTYLTGVLTAEHSSYSLGAKLRFPVITCCLSRELDEPWQEGELWIENTPQISLLSA